MQHLFRCFARAQWLGASFQGPLGPVREEGGDVAHQIVVVGFGVAHPGREADVGGDDGRPGGGGHRQVAGIPEAADVVADHGPRGAGRGQDVGIPGVGRNRPTFLI